MKFLLITLTLAPIAAWAGPFSTDFIPAADPRFSLWASSATIDRGLSDIAFDVEPLFYAEYGTFDSALGPADAVTGGDDENGNPFPVVSLGDAGTATLTFDSPISDIAGQDLAVFENPFNEVFLELAHVEVSSDGLNFFRFPSISLTQTTTQIAGFGTLDATDLHNLAGTAPGGSATPFDLEDLRHHFPALDINRITHVRVIDVVGSLNPAHRSLDSLGNPINDPYPTDFITGGFDLDAVGAFAAIITTYDDWTASRMLTGNDALPTADPDHDQIPNLISYLTGHGVLNMDRTSTQTTIQFTRLSYRADADLRVESCSTFGDWEPLATSVSGGAFSPAPGSQASVTETGDHLVQVSISLPPSSGKRFFRLAAEK